MLQWIECPSVTGPEGSTFLIADTENGRRWVVRNRIKQRYEVHGPQNVPREGRSCGCRVYGYFYSQKEGKQFVEDGLAVGDGIAVK